MLIDAEGVVMETVGERLKWARSARLVEQEELAGKAGVGVATISRIENGRLLRSPRLSTLRRLADALEVDYLWLATGDEDMESKSVA